MPVSAVQSQLPSLALSVKGMYFELDIFTNSWKNFIDFLEMHLYCLDGGLEPFVSC